jgi:hypothetical protein
VASLDSSGRLLCGYCAAGAQGGRVFGPKFGGYRLHAEVRGSLFRCRPGKPVVKEPLHNPTASASGYETRVAEAAVVRLARNARVLGQRVTHATTRNACATREQA